MHFKNLFGIEKLEIKKHCVLAPFLAKGLLEDFGIKKLHKGTLFASGNTDQFTFIHTKIGATLTGDAILYLKDSPCEHLILFGSCGLVDKNSGISIGDLVTPQKCICLESFSHLIQKNFSFSNEIIANNSRLDNLDKKGISVKPVKCCTFGSLQLEEDFQELFIQHQIDVIDLECSAFFSAAKAINKDTNAIMFITDIIKEKPFYRAFDSHDHIAFNRGIKNAAKLINLLTS